MYNTVDQQKKLWLSWRNCSVSVVFIILRHARKLQENHKTYSTSKSSAFVNFLKVIVYAGQYHAALLPNKTASFFRTIVNVRHDDGKQKQQQDEETNSVFKRSQAAFIIIPITAAIRKTLWNFCRAVELTMVVDLWKLWKQQKGLQRKV